MWQEFTFGYTVDLGTGWGALWAARGGHGDRDMGRSRQGKVGTVRGAKFE